MRRKNLRILWIRLRSVSKESDLVSRDLRKEVKDPCDNVTDTGYENKDADYEGDDVSGLKET